MAVAAVNVHVTTPMMWNFLAKMQAVQVSTISVALLKRQSMRGQPTVNIPDTVGFCLPNEYGNIIAQVRNRVPNIDKAVISVHCHNDLGMATANSFNRSTKWCAPN